jgi:hypothetical protein
MATFAVSVSGCNGESEVGGFITDLYDREVHCDGGEDCVDAYGEVAPFEGLRGFAFVTTETSAHHPDGLFVYFEIERTDGSLGRGELDVPLDGEGEAVVSYTEILGSETVFVAEEAIGIVEVPEEALGEQCDCLDGRFELVLYDAEGQTRRLSRSRFGWEDAPCAVRARFTDLGDTLTVIPRTCGDGVIRRSGIDDPPSTHDPDPPRYDHYDDGCDTSACSGTAGSSAGCGGGSASGCDSGGGSGGCDGGGGGGCEGDVGGAGGCAGDTGGSGGCAGDTGGCRVARHRHVGPRGPLQTMLLIAAALAWVIRPRR